MGPPARLAVKGSGHDAREHRGGESWETPWTRGVPLDPVKTEQEEPTPPWSHGVGPPLEFVGESLVLTSFGGAENELGAKGATLRGGRPRDQVSSWARLRERDRPPERPASPPSSEEAGIAIASYCSRQLGTRWKHHSVVISQPPVPLIIPREGRALLLAD